MGKCEMEVQQQTCICALGMTIDWSCTEWEPYNFRETSCISGCGTHSHERIDPTDTRLRYREDVHENEECDVQKQAKGNICEGHVNSEVLGTFHDQNWCVVDENLKCNTDETLYSVHNCSGIISPPSPKYNPAPPFPFVPPSFPPPPLGPKALCSNTCILAHNEKCDESSHLCEAGTDCSDCGIYVSPPPPVIPSPSPPPPSPPSSPYPLISPLKPVSSPDLVNQTYPPATPPTVATANESHSGNGVVIGLSISLGIMLFMLSFASFIWYRRKKPTNKQIQKNVPIQVEITSFNDDSL